jgi:hypothetical protein
VREIRQLWHDPLRAFNLAPTAAKVQTDGMPLFAIVLVTLATLGSILFVANQIRALRRRRRNLRHWERNEPLEGVGDWD